MKLNKGATPDNGRKFFLESWPSLGNQTFSTRFSSDHFSWINMGEYKNSAVAESNLTQIEMYDDFFWSAGMDAIRIGDNDANAAKFNSTGQGVFDANNGLYTIFDSASPEIYISALFFEDFINMFFEVHKVEKEKFEATNKTVTATCTGNEDWKSVYFLVGGQWLEARADDYMKFVKGSGRCDFHFRGIDAPFNILGHALYMDYYVTHSVGNDTTTMSFASNGRSIKDTPESVSDSFAPEKVMSAQLKTEDDPDAPFWALAIGIIFCAAVLGASIYYGIWGFTNDKFAVYVMVLIIVGGVIGSLIVGVVIFILVYDGLTPGISYESVEDADTAITKVNATNMTFFGLVSFAIYKMFGNKTEEKKTEAVAEVEIEESANQLM